MKKKIDYTKICCSCHKGTPQLQATRFELRAGAAIEHWRCDTCGRPLVKFRLMTDAEKAAETEKFLKAEDARRAIEAERAERERIKQAEWDRQVAENMARLQASRRGV